MSSFPIALLYPLTLLSIPFIATSNTFNDVLLSRLAYELNLHHIPSDPVIVSIGAVTLYCYFILDAVPNIMKLFTDRDFHIESSQQELAKLYPPFVVSACIIFVNTNHFDNIRASFILIQTMAYFIYPFAALKKETKDICNMFFKCALFWSILYAISPGTVKLLITVMAYYANNVLSGRPQQVYYVF
ncbi:hypothetical protein K501DRAFT_3792 [Backusella circina FSU 941]|nr:hypothetical protein K501DRAFT_3792 [Backusella circina FSU 941]